MKRWIVISPHFDDAVLSCGGLIWEQGQLGQPVEIWTVNAGMPPEAPPSDLITRVHTQWKTGTPRETVALRRIEDKNAAQRLGAKTQHLDMLDAIYRRNARGDYLYTIDVFDPIHPDESGIVEAAARQISINLRDEDILLCPLALGDHVDHVITRLALESLKLPLLYYADIPYLFTHPDALEGAVSGMQPQDYQLTTAALVAWQEAILAYASQLSSLFGDADNMRTLIADYCNSRGGLRLWHSPSI